MFIKRTLFFKNLHSGGYRPKVTDGDKFAQTFGTIIPSSIPESSAWWLRDQSRLCELFAMLISSLYSSLEQTCKCAHTNVVMIPTFLEIRSLVQIV